MDPMVRHASDPAPLIPGTLLRFRWPSDPSDTEVIRSTVQESGRGLFVLEAPMPAGGTTVKVLAEAYYPEDVRASYFENMDPFRKADSSMGRLIVVSTLDLKGTIQVGSGVGSFFGYIDLTSPMLDEIRRNNRNANSRLKRNASREYWMQERENLREAEEAKVFDEWAEAYTHMYLEGAKYGRTPEHGGAVWKQNVQPRR